MKTRFVCFLGSVFFLFFSGVASAGIFQDDFTGGESGYWGVAGDYGDWSASGGVYSPAYPDNFPNAHSSLPWTLTDFSAGAVINNAYDGGFWLRSANSAGAIGATGVLLVTVGGDLYWHHVAGESYGSIINRAYNAYDENSPLDLRVTVQGSQYSAFIGDSVTPATTYDDGGAFGGGMFALYAFNGAQNFDSVRVEGQGVPSNVPLPAAFWLLAGGLGGLGAVKRRLKK